MTFISPYARSAGSLVGLAIGDALGAPLEGLPPPAYPVTGMESGGIHHIARGTTTDDTDQACAVARSLVICRGYSPADLMQRLIAAYLRQPEFYGPTSSTVFRLVLSGVPLTDAAQYAHECTGQSRSNGAVMRGPPIGIFYPPSRVREVSCACARLTHHDPVAQECSAFVNRMVSELVRGGSPERAYFHALSSCENSEVRSGLVEIRALPLVPSLDALDATRCALAAFLFSPSFEAAVTAAVNLGGDADTIGAICGALAGARYGYPAIPVRWRCALRGRAPLLALAKDLHLAAQGRP
ncbi:MAG: ADP-ribosylglycohydrolase family protein [Methanomicrobiaceae archaeon]|nr:ADP-ribosylglycohydrolase family protein [Methanomicrobiaceae archaeon]